MFLHVGLEGRLRLILLLVQTLQPEADEERRG